MKHLFFAAMFAVVTIGCDPEEEEPEPQAPPAPNAAQGLSFLDEDSDGGQIAGLLTIERALDESNVTDYQLYWGSSATTKLAGEPIVVSLGVSSSALEHTFAADAAVPAGATHFLVYTYNSAAKFEVPTAVDVSVPTALEIRDLTIERVADIRPGTASSNPASFAIFQNQLFFAADSDTQGRELFVYDGTAAPTVAQDINTTAGNNGGSDPEYLTPYGGKLLFRATAGGATSISFDLWEYDGSNDATVVDAADPANLTVFASRLYYSGFTALEGAEPWMYDGSNAPSMVADIMDQAQVPGHSSSPSFFTDFDGTLYFAAADRTDGRELWALDTSTAPWQVADINTGGNAHPEELIVFDDALFFSATDGTGYELWRYDGTNPPAAVTSLGATRVGFPPTELCVYEGTLYFQADDDTDGAELFGYTVAGGEDLVADIDPSGDSSPTDLIEFDGRLFFAARRGGIGRELWAYDGSNPPVAYEIIAGTTGGSPEHLFVWDEALYFSATSDGTGADRELWRLYYQ